MDTFSDLLFNASWWMLAIVAGGGVFSLISGLRRVDKKLLRLGIALVLIASLVGTLRMVFPTAREKMEKRSRLLVQAVDRQDWNALRAALDPNTVVGFRAHTVAAGRDGIVAALKDNCERYGLKSVSIIGMDSERTETLITVSLVAYSVQDLTRGQPATSTWQLDYQQSGEQWILEKITLVRIGNTEADNYPF